MVANNHTVLLYSKEDAKEFILKSSSLKFKKIYALTPDAYAGIRNKVDEKKIILPPKSYTKSHHKKTIDKVKIFQNLFIKKILKSEFKPYQIEILKHLIHFTISSAYYLWFSIEKNGPWLVYNGSSWKYIKSKNRAYNIFYERVYTVMQPNFFGQIPQYKQLSKFLINIINNISIKLFMNKKSIWFTGDQYRMKEIAEEMILQKKGLTIFYLQPLQKYTLFKTISSFIGNLSQILIGKKINEVYLTPLVDETSSMRNKIKRLFLNHSVQPITAVSDLIIDNFSQVLDYLQSIENSVSQLVSITNPSLLISHQLKAGDAILLGSCFREKNLPVTLISHGSHPYHKDKYAKFELDDNLQGLLASNFASSTVIQSKIALKSFRNFKNINQQIYSHPIMWGTKSNIIKTKKRKKFTILHAGTPKPLGTRPYIYETSFEYLKSIDSLSKIISDMSNVELIIRFRSAAEFKQDSVEALLPKYKNVILKYGGNFYEDLNKADMLISFASTTIEESLYSCKPVGLFGAESRFYHLDGSKKPPTYKKRNSVYHLSESNLKTMITLIKKYHLNKPLTSKELKKYIWDSNVMNFKKFIKLQLLF